MRRILVLTSIERAFYSSVIEYQLLEPVIEVAKQERDESRGSHLPIKFIYIGFVPITFWISRKSPIKSFITFRINRRRVKKWLNENGISCSFIPIIFPLRHRDFYLRIPYIVLYVVTTLPIFLKILVFYRINLIHSRNYPATLLAFWGNSIFGIPYIFDMRDLYPEKGIEAGVFSKFKVQKSWSYKLWKFIEYKLVQGASCVITTSEPFRKYVSSEFRVQSSKVQILPNCVNRARFKPDEGKRKELRKKYGLTDKFVPIHSGSFGTPGDMPMTLKYFSHFKKLAWEKMKSNAVLIILQGIKENLPEIREIGRAIGIRSDEFILLSPEPSEVPELLLLGDVGLHLESMAIATPYCIAVKDGEYLASGLPVIVTPYLKGIAPLIQRYCAGIVIDPLKPDEEKEIRLLDKYEKMRENGFKLVEDYLALNKNVEKLAELYEKF